MPPSAGAARADSLATLGVVRHEWLTLPQVQAWLGVAESADLPPWQAANVREMRRLHLRATCVDAALVEQSSVAQLRCEQAWRQLRAKNDWASFVPLLERVVELKRQIAASLAESLNTTEYDALLDEFEPGAKSAEIAKLFAGLAAFLAPFTEQVLARQRDAQPIQPKGPFPVAGQRCLGLRLMEAIGFDPRQGRLDVSHHPFCGGVPGDVRITTRYSEADFASSLMGVLHEAGHGKYEQGLPLTWRGQPVGLARGMAAHEGQSLLQEMQICRSREFLQFATPIIVEELGESAARQPEAFTVENLYRLCTRVRPGLIRVDADEVTYCSHIILRFEVERGLIDGSVQVKDIPELWNGHMRRLIGVDPGDNFADGCMQDVHWPSGAFGYFPVYALGALTAAQVFRAMKRDLPEVSSEIANGTFGPINAWLAEKIWSQGSLHSAKQLAVHATGEELTPVAFQEHLVRRYLPA